MKSHDILSLVLSGLALLVSVLALILTRLDTIEANRIALEALGVAQQSNQIALGLERTVPKLRVTNLGDNDLIEDRKLSSGEFEIRVVNEGEVPIDAVKIELISIPGFNYSYDFEEEGFYLGSATELMELDEMLNPGGVLYIDLTPLVAKQLQAANHHFQNPLEVYRATFNAIIVGRKVGDELPSQADEDLSNNRTLLEFDFVPANVQSDISSILSDNDRIKIRVIP